MSATERFVASAAATCLAAVTFAAVIDGANDEARWKDAEKRYTDATNAPVPTVTVTAPPKTITATVRVTERASRVHSRGASPDSLPTSRTTSEGTRERMPGGASRVSDYQAYARARVPADQWPCLKRLVQRESSWRPTAVTGSHYGLFQMRGLKHSTGWQYQIERGLDYIEARYGTPCKALAHSDRKGWY